MIQQDTNFKYQQISLANQLITVKRIDLIHPTISGNKFYKLKYNLQFAKKQGYSKILSFGGAYSNHVNALAHACHEFGFDSIGIIRGDELANKPLNPTLAKAKSLGMTLKFISRQAYRHKDSKESLQDIQQQYPDAYIIPEGGTNSLAVKGCAEILSEDDKQNFDIIVCAVGTGGTIAGIINASDAHQQVIGFSALNSDYQQAEIKKWTEEKQSNQPKNWQLLKDNYFGGYGKYNDELLEFIKQVQEKDSVPLEPIYTGKALFYLQRMFREKKISHNQRILFIHTGGLQGFLGLNT